jgi:hypothetical protein
MTLKFNVGKEYVDNLYKQKLVFRVLKRLTCMCLNITSYFNEQELVIVPGICELNFYPGFN